MFRHMLRSKIHRATVTETCLGHESSLRVDEDLLDAAGILPYQAVVCSNVNNGERFMTYAMAGERGSGEIVLNGPTARKGAVGDHIIIFCMSTMTKKRSNAMCRKLSGLIPEIALWT